MFDARRNGFSNMAKVVRFMDLDSDLDPLKPKQIEAIKSSKSGKDTFVSLPTGYGAYNLQSISVCAETVWQRETIIVSV